MTIRSSNFPLNKTKIIKLFLGAFILEGFRSCGFLSSENIVHFVYILASLSENHPFTYRFYKHRRWNSCARSTVSWSRTLNFHNIWIQFFPQFLRIQKQVLKRIGLFWLVWNNLVATHGFFAVYYYSFCPFWCYMSH